MSDGFLAVLTVSACIFYSCSVILYNIGYLPRFDQFTWEIYLTLLFCFKVLKMALINLDLHILSHYFDSYSFGHFFVGVGWFL